MRTTAKPIFNVFGKGSIQWAGLAKQSSAKLAINYLLGLNLQGLAETLSRKSGEKKTCYPS
jgi:3-hydroxyisobutyrate dehydrogenase